MRYELRILAAGFGSGIQISREDYESLKAARLRIFRALEIEEKMDILLENFAEYENERLSLALQDSLFSTPMWVEAMGRLHRMNRRAVNLLSSAKLYIDQVKHDSSIFFSRDGNKKEEVEKLFSSEYDSSPEYRIGEALRNFVQHRGLPVDQLSFPSQWEDRESGLRVLHCSAEAMIDVGRLREEGGFKSGVLDELESASKQHLDLTLVLRLYVEGLGRVHEAMRVLLKDQIDRDRQRISDAMEGAKAALSDTLTGLALVQVDESGAFQDRHYLNLKAEERRQRLVKKNRALSSIAARYVSSALQRDH